MLFALSYSGWTFSPFTLFLIGSCRWSSILLLYMCSSHTSRLTDNSVARYSICIKRVEKNADKEEMVSAFLNIESWRKNTEVADFDVLKKGALVELDGFFKPEEWTDGEGVKHNRVVLVATSFKVVTWNESQEEGAE